MKAFISVPLGDAGRGYFTEDTVKYTKELGEVVMNPHARNMTSEEIADIIGDCDVYVTWWGSPKLDNTILSKAQNLKLLAHTGGSVYPYVSPEMWDRGIRVISGNYLMAESVAEGTVAYMLSALRDIPKYSANLKEKGIWRTEDGADCKTKGLKGKTVGIISYGMVAKNVVRVLQPFGVKLLVYDIREIPEEDRIKYGITQVSLPEIFAQSDVVSLHTPLNDKTFHMIGKEHFDLMKDGSLFVNTSRGKVIDQRAMEEALTAGRFKAVLDVYETEPPEKDCALFKLPNVIMIPHMAGPTYDLREYTSRVLMAESAAFIDRGEALVSEITREMAEVMTR